MPCVGDTLPMIGARRAVRRLAAAVGQCTFPDACVFCGAKDVMRSICVGCFRDLPRIESPCACCGVPMQVPSATGLTCAACQLRPPPFNSARAALLYAFPVDAALKALKFRHRLWYVPAFTELLLAELSLHFPDVDALVPVPLHHRRHATRGFNQAHELCRPLGRRTGLPLVRDARRIRPTEPQTGLDAIARRRNLRNAFAVGRKLRCRHPLIVDDVMTTGETCRQLAVALQKAGASTVNVLTVARARRPRPRVQQGTALTRRRQAGTCNRARCL